MQSLLHMTTAQKQSYFFRKRIFWFSVNFYYLNKITLMLQLNVSENPVSSTRHLLDVFAGLLA